MCPGCALPYKHTPAPTLPAGLGFSMRWLVIYEPVNVSWWNCFVEVGADGVE